MADALSKYKVRRALYDAKRTAYAAGIITGALCALAYTMMQAAPGCGSPTAADGVLRPVGSSSGSNPSHRSQRGSDGEVRHSGPRRSEAPGDLWIPLEVTNPPGSPEGVLMTPFRPGVPSVGAYSYAKASPLFKAMERFSGAFLTGNAAFVEMYKVWSADPLHAWSRVYEYPWHAEAIRALLPAEHAATLASSWPDKPAPAHKKGGTQFKVLDAGSGFTFYDQFLASRLGVHVEAVDYKDLYRPWFEGANQDLFPEDPEGTIPRVPYHVSSIEDMSATFPDETFDVITCVSVLEHVKGLALRQTVAEFVRILKPGGALVLTFDTGEPPIAIDPLASAELLGALRYALDEDTSFAPPSELAGDDTVMFTNHHSTPPEFTKSTFSISGHVFRKRA